MNERYLSVYQDIHTIHVRKHMLPQIISLKNITITFNHFPREKDSI
jgi:hypothetical protein